MTYGSLNYELFHLFICLDIHSKVVLSIPRLDFKTEYEHDPSLLRQFFLKTLVIQGLVLSSFSWGYLTTQLTGGIMAEKYGTKKVYGFNLFLCGILSFLSPWVAKWHFYAFITLRVLQGAVTKSPSDKIPV